MQKLFLAIFLTMFLISVQGQQYSSVGGIETNYKGQYQFKVRLDEQNQTLTFETDAPVSVVTLQTYTEEERRVMKGKEYTDKFFTKKGNVYTYDLKQAELKNKYAYWLIVSTGRNGSTLAEYYFQRKSTGANTPGTENGKEEKNANGETIIRTNATCTEGKEKLTAALKALDGVKKVTIDPRGTVAVNYSSDGTPFNQLLATINQNGFNANEKISTNPSANPCGKITTSIKLTPNILDATPGYIKAPIKFVPIQPDYTKGYSDTKVYNWKDDAGNSHTGTGKEILDEVNKLEEQLNLRGHSLREKRAFDGLTFPLNSMSKNDFTNCAIINKLKKPPVTYFPKFDKVKKLKNINVAKDKVNATIYSYLGSVITAAEFRQANMNSSASFVRSGNNATATMQLVFHTSMYQKANTCKVEVSEKLNGPTLFSTTIETKKYSAQLNAAQSQLNFGDAVEPQYLPANYTLFSYNLVFVNAVSKLPPETCTAIPYFLKLSFYDAAGKLIETYQPNDLVLNNQLPVPINIPNQGGKTYTGYDYEFLDPGLHCFGFYAKSDGFSSSYFAHGQGYTGDERRASVKADMEIGVKYYNWERLINSNAPLTKEYPLFGYDIQSEEKYSRPDNCLPPIRVKGYGKEDPDQGVVTLLGESYNLSSTNENIFTKTINPPPIADIDFFIGPVPCNITVSLSGKISVSVDYQSNTKGYCDAKVTVNPHADITLHGSGGINAKIMYAQVYADVDLLKIDMPCTIEASNTEHKSTIQPELKVGGLSGQVYFKAGFCIPIPLVDDICESFRIDILNWKGFDKNFTVDPKKGITL